MPTHKIANDFIRKYNKNIAIKNYSKLRLGEKVNKIETHTKRVGGKMKTDWESAKSKHSSTKKKKKITRKMRVKQENADDRLDADDLAASRRAAMLAAAGISNLVDLRGF